MRLFPIHPTCAACLLAVFLLAVGCNDYGFGGPCRDENRAVASSGDIVDLRGRRLGVVSASVAEQRDSASAMQAAYFTVTLLGPSDSAAGPLRGHIATIRVLGRGDTLIAALPVDQIPPTETGGPALARANFLRFADTLAVAPLRQLLLQDRVRVELTTDEDRTRTFIVPLRRTTVTDWTHPMCL